MGQLPAASIPKRAFAIDPKFLHYRNVLLKGLNRLSLQLWHLRSRLWTVFISGSFNPIGHKRRRYSTFSRQSGLCPCGWVDQPLLAVFHQYWRGYLATMGDSSILGFFIPTSIMRVSDG